MTCTRTSELIYARMLGALLIILLCGPSESAPATPRFKAVAFDFLVLFDANSVIPAVEQAFPGHGTEFARAWRAKQFEYGFLRSITGRQTDFLKVTEDALVYTAAAMHLDLLPETRKALLQAYLHLKPWPDTESTLRRLRADGVHVVVVSNFSAAMLRANADAAGITGLFDQLISTELNASYKPEARAYALGMQRLGLRKGEILFAAFGGWDAYGAKQFGYTTYWVNRFKQPAEALDRPPDQTSDGLEGLLAFVDSADGQPAHRR